jgi:hypothetical protein
MTITSTELDEAVETAPMADIGAEFVGTFLMPQHRGVLDCGDHFLIFGNDGYRNDPRSRREAEIMLQHLQDDSPTLGVNKEGYTWANVVTDYERATFDQESLVECAWDAWRTACAEAEELLNASDG